MGLNVDAALVREREEQHTAAAAAVAGGGVLGVFVALWLRICHPDLCWFDSCMNLSNMERGAAGILFCREK
jgi:hypothetical protein